LSGLPALKGLKCQKNNRERRWAVVRRQYRGSDYRY